MVQAGPHRILCPHFFRDRRLGVAVGLGFGVWVRLQGSEGLCRKGGRESVGAASDYSQEHFERRGFRG